MKKFFTVLFILFVVSVSSVFAIGKPEQKATYTVGICQLVQHPALDAATQGFMDVLKKEFGDDIKFDLQNASGEVNNCSTIINGFVSKRVNLILANATAPLQVAASATTSIPVLGTSITNYATALELKNYNGTVGGNISGTSDLAPLDEQALMFKEWFPNAKTVGLLYCSAESNSQYQVETMEKHLQKLGYKTNRFSFTDTNDLAAVTQMACEKSDVIYIPTDNSAASNTESIANILISNSTPAIAGEEGICSGCGVATLSISYYDLGVTTGEMAVKILKGSKNISEMPIEYTSVTKKYNPRMCEIFGLQPLNGYEPIQEN